MKCGCSKESLSLLTEYDIHVTKSYEPVLVIAEFESSVAIAIRRYLSHLNTNTIKITKKTKENLKVVNIMDHIKETEQVKYRRKSDFLNEIIFM